jgi:AP-1 complex subunit beta-1
MSDGKFFSATNSKSEVQELKTDLNSLDKVKVKDALKKIIAAMTVGKDVSSLFTDVVKSIQTENVELKKLVYLYVINYARSEPEKAILVVSTFQRDASGQDPLIRALALRTMGCIRVDHITEYLCEPLGRGLKDKDPYVRKTAAVCVAKLYELNSELAEEQGFLDSLRALVADSNPMVVGNAVAALGEISELSGEDVFQINANVLSKLLVALNECTEWSQVFILDCLAKYEPSAKEAENIATRVSPLLKHSNAAVAMSSVRVVVKSLNYIQNAELRTQLIEEKLPPPLITLLGEHKPEIQYVALRNINLICQKHSDLLQNALKHFFCKYNDPVYVKLEKLQVMVQLTNMKNIDKALSEFKEYAGEVDIKIVRKAVSAIGQCAIKLEKAAARCIAVLLELIKTKVSYVMQEAIVVIRDIFRKYPGKYESIIGTLCENLDTLDEPGAKAAMIWIVGEYAERIDNARELLESFVESFTDESGEVQLQLLTAVVKLFLKKPEDAKDLVTTVLNLATDNSDNPDLRDRGYVYWRLLSSDPKQAEAVILAKKPDLSENSYSLDPSVLDVLLNNLSTLSSVYHKPPELFVFGAKATLTLKATNVKKQGSDSDSDSESEDGGDGKDSPEDSDSGEGSGSGSDSGDEKTAVSTAPTKPVELDLFGGLLSSAVSTPAVFVSNDPIVLPMSQGKGIQVRNSFLRQNGALCMNLTFENGSQQTISQFALKFNVNYAGLSAAAPLRVSPVPPGGSASALLPLNASGESVPSAKPGVLQCALKTDLGQVVYFQASLPVYLLFEESGKLQDAEFLRIWASILPQNEFHTEIPNRVPQTVEAVKAAMSKYNVFFIAHRPAEGRGDVMYFSMRYKGATFLADVAINGPVCTSCVKGEQPSMGATVLQGLEQIMRLQ